MEIKINTYPKEKEDKACNSKILEIVKRRNTDISKKLNFNTKDIEIDLFFSTTKLISQLQIQGETLGIFAGSKDYSNKIYLAHPTIIEPIFGENLDKQLLILIDYCLYKIYFCQKYFPIEDDFRLYHKYLSESLSKILSGNFVQDSILFEIKNFNEFKKYSKEQELMISLYIILEKSKSEFLFSNLDTFFKTLNIKKAILKIFNKEFKELINLYKKELEIKEKQIKKV